MMNHRLLGLSLLALVGLQAVAWATDLHVAQIVYHEGRPVVFRDGRRVWDPVESGFQLEAFDFIRNDHESLVEIRAEPRAGVDAAIIAGPRTTFALGLLAHRYAQHDTVDSMSGLDMMNGLELMTGAVAVTIGPGPGASEPAPDSRFTVRTEPIVIDARSASFDVMRSPRGDVLISTREGLVECRLDDERVLFSRPGVVVELSADGSFRNIPVTTVTLAEFKSRWTANRAAALSADFEPVVREYAGQYARLRDRFDEQYVALFTRRDVLDTWMHESLQGRIGSATDVDREKSEIGAYLRGIRPTLARLEKMYYRALELRTFAADGFTAGSTTSRSTVDFFDTVDLDRRVLERRMLTVRYVLKMYAQRNGEPEAR